MLCRLLADGRGATAVEYGLIAALIVVAMIGGLAALGGGTGGMWTELSTTVADAI
ncbi:MAG: Flp family type IVb pilin [Sphingomonas sp.]|nr:Flp family type IVb pilin [Sphingomonas sp.]